MLGDTVGSYRIEAKLGEGGMGVVYVAEHPLLKKKAVVKFLHAELSSDAELVERFFNEARSATMIRHPGIVDVFDFGHHKSGCAFILMEFLHGESLSDRVKSSVRLDAGTAILIAKQIAAALAAAHDQGIVHRDLKPDNVFLVADRDAPGGIRVKVLDFGIAKLVNETSGSVKTQTGAVMGTPTYMAPEQCRSAAEVDHRADIYALGCILFELVTGRPPFRTQSLGQLIAAHMFEPPPPPTSFEPSVPADLGEIILRALAKEPDERQGSMSELAVELAGCAATVPAAPGRRSQPVAIALDPTMAPSTAPGNKPSVRTVPLIVSTTAPAYAATVATSPGKPRELTTLGKSAGELAMPTTRPSRARWAIGAGAVIALGAGFVIWQRGTTSAESATPAKPAAPVEVAPPPVEPPPRVEPRPIKLTLDSDPSGAAVIQEHDGMRIGKTPFDKTLAPVANGTLVYVLRLEGYEDLRVELAADRDNREKAALKPLRPKTQAARPRPPSPPKTKPPTPSPAAPTGPTSDGMLRPKT